MDSFRGDPKKLGTGDAFQPFLSFILLPMPADTLSTNGEEAFSTSEVSKDETVAPDVEQGFSQTRANSSRWWTIRYFLIISVLLDFSSSWRNHCREPLAELLGVCVLIVFGTGVDCQVVLSTDTDVAPSHRGVCIFLRSIIMSGCGGGTDLRARRVISQSTSDGQLVQLWEFGLLEEYPGLISTQLRVPTFEIRFRRS